MKTLLSSSKWAKTRYGEKIWVSRSIIWIQARKGKINTFIFYSNDHSFGQKGKFKDPTCFTSCRISLINDLNKTRFHSPKNVERLCTLYIKYIIPLSFTNLLKIEKQCILYFEWIQIKYFLSLMRLFVINLYTFLNPNLEPLNTIP